MSNTPQVIITAPSDVILKKKQAWAEVGLTVHNANIALEQKAKAALDLLNGTSPKTIDEVVNSENILKQVKATLASIESERKTVTSKFDAVTSALMTHEKAVKDALPAYQKAIIEIKKIDEANKAKIKAAEEAKKLAKEKAINYVSDEFTRMKDMVADLCQKAYEHALEKNVTLEKLSSYLTKLKAKKTDKDFTVVKPENMLQEDFDHGYKSIDMAAPSDMLLYYHKQMDAKFEFYEVALKNKDAAIQASKEAEERAKQEREEELANAKVAARLETISTPTEALVDNGVKELKKKYTIDMPDDEASILLIMTAFITNFAQAKDGVRVKSLMKLSIEQMGTALAWLKNKDNAFNFTGINFKIEEKL